MVVIQFAMIVNVCEKRKREKVILIYLVKMWSNFLKKYFSIIKEK